MPPSIIILLSTYNGSKFLKEQLESIFAQTLWPQCTLIVRDDGSTDNTVSILSEYEKQGLLSLHCGKNIGFVQSFFSLLREAPQADFYAFADQDDIWTPNHIECLLSTIRKNYVACANAQLLGADGTLQPTTMQDVLYIKHFPYNQPDALFFRLLFYNFVQGSATLISHEFRQKLVLPPASEHIDFHDHWFALCAAAENKIAYTDSVILHYRQHSTSVTSSYVSFFSILKRESAAIRSLTTAFSHYYGENLPTNYKALLQTAEQQHSKRLSAVSFFKQIGVLRKVNFNSSPALLLYRLFQYTVYHAFFLND